MDVFLEVPCLIEKSKSLNGLVLQKKWFKKADKRIIGQYLQKFINYNSELFSFLGVQPVITGTDQNISLFFRTSNFIGSIPLRSSDTGKQIGDFVVTPRFSGQNRYEDYIEILNLLDSQISPDVIDSLPLVSGKNFRPPLYLEAVKYINLIEELTKKSWRKFDNIEKNLNNPSGQVNWYKYALNEAKVENKTKFPSRINVLNQFHTEYSELRYVFDLCVKEINSQNTPLKTKTTIKPKIISLEDKLYSHKPKITKQIVIRYTDTPLVKECKQIANKILSNNLSISTAWRVDFSEVFERFIQYIFEEVSKEIGGKLFNNFRFQSKATKKFTWQLHYLEPDAIYQKDDITIFIDAKYKSNMYNKFDKSIKLKEDHRHDLHQILAYSSFEKFSSKNSFICYPSNNIEIEVISYQNHINETTNTIYLCGIKFQIEGIKEAKNKLIEIINKIEQKEKINKTRI